MDAENALGKIQHIFMAKKKKNQKTGGELPHLDKEHLQNNQR